MPRNTPAIEPEMPPLPSREEVTPWITGTRGNPDLYSAFQVRRILAADRAAIAAHVAGAPAGVEVAAEAINALESLARACSKDDPEAFYAEVHTNALEAAERAGKQLRARLASQASTQVAVGEVAGLREKLLRGVREQYEKRILWVAKHQGERAGAELQAEAIGAEGVLADVLDRLASEASNPVDEVADADFIDRYRLLRKLAHPLEGPFVITMEGEEGSLYGSYLDAELDKRLAASPASVGEIARWDDMSLLRRCLEQSSHPDAIRALNRLSAVSAKLAASPSHAGGTQHLDIAADGVQRLLDALMPNFEYTGVALRVSAEDHAEIRSAMAGARTSLRLIRNVLADQAAGGEAPEPKRGQP